MNFSDRRCRRGRALDFIRGVVFAEDAAHRVGDFGSVHVVKMTGAARGASRLARGPRK